jgi:hypothetical protein
LVLGLGQAHALPGPALNGLASQTSPVEKAHYYGRRYGGYWGGYYPYYRYYRPYSYYYRPYYGYHYYKPYRHYGYRHRRWW